MTTYVYNCKQCAVDRDIVHGMTETPEFHCDTCTTKLSKVIRNLNFQLKGSGWFKDNNNRN